MMNPRPGVPLSQIQTLFELGTFGGLTDGELLDRFSTGSREVSELAMAVLVERHGPMVHRVCRSILRDAHHAEDAFQATFFVLARQATSIRSRDSIASWLHGVARRVAICSLDAENRRRRHERNASKPEVTEAKATQEHEELGRVVQDELGRLPEKYRAPIVLCHLEGLTHEQAAQRLRWPVGTVRSRLSRGRDRLRSRLIRRGAAQTALIPILATTGETATAGVPLSLVQSTVRDALVVAVKGFSPADSISPPAASLAKGALKAMSITKLKLAGTLMAVVMATTGAGLFATNAIRAQHRPAPPKATAVPQAKAKDIEKKDAAEAVEIRHVDRINLGRLHVGALAEADFTVRYKGPVDPGLSIRVETPPFATVTRMRIFRRDPNPVESMSYSGTILIDTKTPGELSGDLKIHLGDRVTTIPVAASVQPAKPDAKKILVLTGEFGNGDDESSYYDPWLKMVKAENLDVSYWGMMGTMTLNPNHGPDGKALLPPELAKYDVILVDGMGACWLDRSSVYYLQRFVESGKRLILVAAPGMGDSVEKVNLFLTSVGLRMEPEEIHTRGSGYFESNERQITPDFLTNRVRSLYFFRPGKITVIDPKIAKLLDKEGEEANGFLAVSRPGKGEVVVISDWLVMSWITRTPKNSDNPDNLRCLRNMLTKPVE